MADDFNPNPLGSYYAGGPSSAALSIPEGVSAMMGNPRGGFNPTHGEYWNRRMMTSERERFMSELYKTDPRSMAMSSALSHQLFGSDHRERQAFMNKIGGRGNFNELVGWAMNHQAIAGFTGGSIHSLGVGALGAMSGGLTMGGQGIFGDHMVSMMGARALMGRVNQQFYGPTGSANLSATQGLSRDQIGGLMLTAGTQGAFAGMNIGSIINTGGVRSFATSDSSLTRITEFTKTAAKFVSGLIDVFGNGSVGQLLGKAQAITGLDLSRIENANTISSRLSTLRNNAMVNGMDTASVFALAQTGTAMGQAMGLHSATAGALSHHATVTSLNDFASRKLMGGGLYLPSVSPTELMQQRLSEATSMSIRDPMGQLRMSTELMFESGYGTAEQRQMIRTRLAAARPGDDLKEASFIHQTLGRHPTDIMFQFGGPGGVAKALSQGGMSNVIAGGEADLRSRQEDLMRMRFGSDSEVFRRLTTESMSSLAGTKDPALATAIKIMQNTPELSTYRSAVDRSNDARRLFLSSGGSISAADRGFALQSGFAQGLFGRLAGEDPGSTYQMLTAFAAPLVLGSKPGQRFSLDADFLEKNPSVRASSFGALRDAVQGMSKGDNDRYGGNALLQLLGIGTAGVINESAVMQNLRDPSVLAQIGKDWVNMTDDQGMSQLAPRGLFDRMSPKNVQIAQMIGATKILGEHSGTGVLFNKMLQNLGKGGTQEDMDKQIAAFHREINNEVVLKEFDGEKIKKLAGNAYGGLGREIANSLEQHKMKYQAIMNSDPQGPSGQNARTQLTEIETKLKALREAGVVSDADLGITNMTGKLIFETASGQYLGTGVLDGVKLSGGKPK